jgi:hypothetical protein
VVIVRGHVRSCSRSSLKVARDMTKRDLYPKRRCQLGRFKVKASPLTDRTNVNAGMLFSLAVLSPHGQAVPVRRSFGAR